MASPNSDYLSPWSDDASPESYDAAALLDDQTEPKGTETETQDERLHSSPTYALHSHSTENSSENTEICEKSEWLLPSGNGPFGRSAPESAGVVTDLSLFNLLSQNNKRPITGAGMENLGNTCFLNSVLQCFVHTVPLLHGILLNGYLAHSNCNKEGFCLLCALRDLIVHSLTNRIVSPCNLADNLSYISSNFQRFQQEDAHEFLQCFLDRLESCHDSKMKGYMSSQSDNIVKQVFGGRLISKLTCCNCGHRSDTYEPSIDLSLEIEDADNLLAALHSFTKVEKIEDPETKFTCEKCNEQVYIEKELSFDQTPSVAALHLKRFKNEGGFVQKIDKHVAFPLDLDLLPFTDSCKKNDAEFKYVLYAIVVHVGLTSTSGHYYCFIRLSPNRWYKFDDSRVCLSDLPQREWNCKIHPFSLLSGFKDISDYFVLPVREDDVLSQEAYVLFYAKESTPWFSGFIETQKKFVHSTIWNTSPKSVLENIDASSVSPSSENQFRCNPSEVSHDIGSEHGRAEDDETKARGKMQNKIESNESTDNLHGMCDLGAPFPSDASVVSLPKPKIVSPVLLENVNQNQEVCAPANCQNDAQIALRSPSPEIYREDPPDAGFSIPRDHLRSVDRMSCKRQLEKDMDDLEMRTACSFIKKNMHSSRGQQLLAALRVPKTEASVHRKKNRRPGSSSDSSESTHHYSKIRPSLRPLIAGTNRYS